MASILNGFRLTEEEAKEEKARRAQKKAIKKRSQKKTDEDASKKRARGAFISGLASDEGSCTDCEADLLPQVKRARQAGTSTGIPSNAKGEQTEAQVGEQATNEGVGKGAGPQEGLPRD